MFGRIITGSGGTSRRQKYNRIVWKNLILNYSMGNWSFSLCMSSFVVAA